MRIGEEVLTSSGQLPSDDSPEYVQIIRQPRATETTPEHIERVNQNRTRMTSARQQKTSLRPPPKKKNLEKKSIWMVRCRAQTYVRPNPGTGCHKQTHTHTNKRTFLTDPAPRG